MALICNILFLYEIFHKFEGKWKSSELYHTEYIHKLSILWNTLHWQSKPGQTEKKIHNPSTQRDFLQCEFMNIFPLKLENQLTINLYHTEKVCSNVDYYIHFNCSGRERVTLLISISLCSHGLYPLWYRIYLLKKE